MIRLPVYSSFALSLSRPPTLSQQLLTVTISSSLPPHYSSRTPMSSPPSKRLSWVTVCYPVYNRRWSHIRISAIIRVLVHASHTHARAHVHMNIQLILIYYTLADHLGSGVIYFIASHRVDPAPMDRKSSFSFLEILNEINCFFLVFNLRVGSLRDQRQLRNLVVQREL